MRPAPGSGRVRRSRDRRRGAPVPGPDRPRVSLIGILYAGTSGFSYPAWRGGFYPEALPASGMLEHYAARLNGVELNGTFYRTPSPEVIAGWSRRVPSNFRFCLKAHRGLTYSADGFDRAGLAAELGVRLAELGGRMGPFLLQFPPARGLDAALLDRVLEALGRPAAVEFRHESWFTDAVYRVLRDRAAALVVTDDESWPMAPRIELGGLAYYRLRRDYSAPALERWRRELRAEAAAREQLHVYFKHESAGPDRACRMLEE